VRIFAQRHWIPPAALIFAQFSHGFAWVLVLWIAWSAHVGDALFGFAWVHAVALGWVTMAALAILIHALPNFIDVPWRFETVARWSIALYGLGVALLLFGFLGGVAVLPLGAGLVLFALLVYLTTAFLTIASVMREHAAEYAIQRAVARAFAGTFSFLLVAAVIGFALALSLSGHASDGSLSALPAAHGNLAALGWLSLLIFGVSQRTIRPITGATTRMRAAHILVGSMAVVGVPLLAIGFAAHTWTVTWIGAALFALSSLIYSADVLDIIRRARNPHRPPQAFIVAGIFWLLVSLALGAGALTGRPWQQAYVFALLMGWVGQYVNAHLYHIGIRLLATIYRGEEDETEPQDLLETRLSWFSWYAFQVAIGVMVYALMSGEGSLLARGAVFGITGWIAMVANVLAARARARIVPRTVILR
jgi:hypothetical protein